MIGLVFDYFIQYGFFIFVGMYIVWIIYFCELCDKSIMKKSKYNCLKSITQKLLDESIIRRYIFLNPILEQIDKIMERSVNNYNKK